MDIINLLPGIIDFQNIGGEAPPASPLTASLTLASNRQAVGCNGLHRNVVKSRNGMWPLCPRFLLLLPKPVSSSLM